MAIPEKLPAVSGYEVESSNVEVVGYDNERRLYVRFKSGDTYVYDNVPESIFKTIATAKLKGGSCGKTYNQLVRSNPPGNWKRLTKYLFAHIVPADKLVAPPRDILVGWVPTPDPRHAAWSW